MGIIVTKAYGIPFKISVKTGDRKGAGTDANVYIAMYDEEGQRSVDIDLDSFWTDDFQTGKTNRFTRASGVRNFGRLAYIELWRDSKGLFDDWFCDVIDILNLTSMERYIFPVHRWVPAHEKFKLRPYDMFLPQHDDMHDTRKVELEKKKLLYQLTNNVAIPQVSILAKTNILAIPSCAYPSKHQYFGYSIV